MQSRYPSEFPVVLCGDRAMLGYWLILQKLCELRSTSRQDPCHFPDLPGAFIDIHGVYVGLGEAPCRQLLDAD